MTLRIALLGTFHPAVPTLRRLAERDEVAIVVMPEEAGEKNEGLLAIAEEFGLRCTYRLDDVQPEDIDLVLAANYPKLVPERLLRAVPCINTHWSLLPRYRGVHPTAWALINGEDETGVTVHVMGADFDTGPVLAQGRLSLHHDTRLVDLHRRLADLQAELVVSVLDHLYEHGVLPAATTQDESQATYVPQRVPSDGLIDWVWPTARIDGLVRALPAPKYPGAFTHVAGRKLIVWEAHPAPTPRYFSTPGQVVRVVSGGPVWVKTGDTCLAIDTVQWDDGGAICPAREVLRRGTRLGVQTELEFVELHRRIADLEAQLTRLRDGVGDG